MINPQTATAMNFDALNGWKPMDSAPKSTVSQSLAGADVRGVYLLGYCPDESAIDPMSCLCIVWWEPHLEGGIWTGEAGYEMRPTYWMPLPMPPAP